MSTIKSSSEDLTLNADGSNDIKFQSNGVEKASISSAGAFTSTTIDATKLTGEKRNYIIDGDFTQWPEGTSFTAPSSSTYGPALWETMHSAGELVYDLKQTVDAPTVAESNYNSTHCMHIDITTAETAVGASEYFAMQYYMTGVDYKGIHGQQATMSFWHKHTKTGTYSVVLRNSANNRIYVFEYTQTSTDTWENHTETITMDSAGTWLFTEADKGMRIIFPVFAGSSFQVAAGSSWGTTNAISSTNQVAGADSASNNFKLSQVCFCLGSTATFTSPPIATVKDQVSYYVEREGGDINSERIGTAVCESASIMNCPIHYRKKRVAPTCSASASASSYNVIGKHTEALTSMSFLLIGTMSCLCRVDIATSMTAGDAVEVYSPTAADYLLYDARH